MSDESTQDNAPGAPEAGPADLASTPPTTAARPTPTGADVNTNAGSIAPAAAAPAAPIATAEAAHAPKTSETTSETTVESSAAEPGEAGSGEAEPGTSGAAEAGAAEASAGEAGAGEAGAGEAGAGEAGAAEAGAAEAGAAEAGDAPKKRRRRRKRRRKPAAAEGQAGQAVAADPAAAAEQTAARGGLHSLTVKAGHVQPLWAGHPWVFAQAVERVDATATAGDEVVIIDPHGKVLGRGLYSPKSAIAARLFTTRGTEAIDGALLRARVEQAVTRRQAHQLPQTLLDHETDGYRLIHGEGDSMPGLIVDAFGDTMVVQLGTAGLIRMRAEVVAALSDVLGPRTIIDRTPAAVAKAEGVNVPAGPLALRGELPALLSFKERGLRYELPLELGQKTGFYFDQRPLRERIEALSRGSRVLDGCCYVGAVAFNAVRGGASEVVAVDRSVPAIEAGKHCASLNGFEDKVRFVAGDVQRAFEEAERDGGFDIVVCDPPKMAPRRASRQQALSGYRRMASGACRAAKPGGIVVLCSCSAAVPMDALQRALALGARDAGKRAVVFDRCFQGPDHPVAAAFPEGLYLTVLLARVEPV